MLNNPIARLRFVGLFEGASMLLLLFIAMPIKYILHHPEMVEIVGMTHGLLFILYIITAVLATRSSRTTHSLPPKLFGLTVAASIIPSGPFMIDRKLKHHEQLPPPA